MNTRISTYEPGLDLTPRAHREFHSDHPAWEYHFKWPMREGSRLAGWPDAPQPSTRAGVVLSAVGCSLEDPTPPGPYFR